MTSETHQLHIRRVVTGTDEAGEAVVLSDGDAPAVTTLPQVPGTALVDLWRDDALPPDLVGTADPTAGDFDLMPAGTLFRIIELAPSDAEPMWHQTPSIDFVYVASGSCTFLYPGGGGRAGRRRFDRRTGHPPRVGEPGSADLPAHRRLGGCAKLMSARSRAVADRGDRTCRSAPAPFDVQTDPPPNREA